MHGVIEAAHRFLRVVFFVDYGKLAPTLEPIGGEVPRPQIPNDWEAAVVVPLHQVSDWKMRFTSSHHYFYCVCVEYALPSIT